MMDLLKKKKGKFIACGVKYRQACVSCGKKIPERQSPPYPGHAKDCVLRKKWMKQGGKKK